MTTKYELEFLINNIINNTAKIERIKHKEDADSQLNQATISRLWRKIYTSKYKIIKLFNLQDYELPKSIE